MIKSRNPSQSGTWTNSIPEEGSSYNQPKVEYDMQPASSYPNVSLPKRSSPTHSMAEHSGYKANDQLPLEILSSVAANSTAMQSAEPALPQPIKPLDVVSNTAGLGSIITSSYNPDDPSHHRHIASNNAVASDSPSPTNCVHPSLYPYIAPYQAYHHLLGQSINQSSLYRFSVPPTSAAITSQSDSDTTQVHQNVFRDNKLTQMWHAWL